MSAERNVRCKKCRRIFQMRATLADRMIAMHQPTCPRCPACELKAKRHVAKVLRAYHLFLERREEVRRRDDLLSFSRLR